MILSKLIFATSYAWFIYFNYSIKCRGFPVFMHLLGAFRVWAFCFAFGLQPDFWTDLIFEFHGFRWKRNAKRVNITMLQSLMPAKSSSEWSTTCKLPVKNTTPKLLSFEYFFFERLVSRSICHAFFSLILIVENFFEFFAFSYWLLIVSLS